MTKSLNFFIKNSCQRLTIRSKFILIVTAISTSSLVFALSLIVYTGMEVYKQDITENSEVISHMLASNIAPALYLLDEDSAQEAVQRLEGVPNVIFVAAAETDNGVSVEFVIPGYVVTERNPLVAGTIIYDNYIETIKLVKFAGESVGYITVRLDSDELNERLKGYINSFIIAFSAPLLLILLLSSIIQRVISKPIDQLVDVANKVTKKGDYQQHIEHNRKDEFGVLLDAFNEMMMAVSQRNMALSNTSLLMKVEKDKANIARVSAEKANKAKSEFLSSMSHELRTPLNAILGFAQLLEMDKAELNEEQSENIKYILDSGYHLLGLINQVLELAKIESGKMTLSIENIVLGDAVGECLPLIQTLADKRQIKITAHSDNCPIFKADFMKMKQILINLMSNAVKYNRDAGTITLEYEQTVPEYLRIKVTDTGMGIPSNAQSKLFTAFSRLGQENSTIEGTGVGLVITKSIVEAMGGEIGFSSEEGVGTTFWVDLPLASSPEFSGGLGID